MEQLFFEYNLVIDKNLDFNVFNNGYATINGNNLGTIFIINSGVIVKLQNLIITKGQGTFGGAIYNNGTLNINNCIFRENNAQNGGAIYNDASINITNTTTVVGNTIPANGGTVVISNTTFINNNATDNGGAIYNGGKITINNSTLTSNTATYNGGTLTVTNSTFRNNNAQNGGAIYNDATIIITNSSTLTTSTATHNGGVLTIKNSTFIGNIATNNGGAIYNGGKITINNSTLTGSTVARNGGTLSINNSVIIGNIAQNGGAIYNDAASIVAASTLTDNTAQNGGTFTITHNTLAGNTATNNGGAIDNNAIINTTDNTLTTNTIQNGAGTLTVTNNTIVGNTAPNGNAIYNYAEINGTNNILTTNTVQNGGIIIATSNWWGSTSGPASNDVAGNSSITVIPFLNYTMNLNITASNSTPKVGKEFIYIIIVTNNGPDDATDVQLIDGIPPGFNFNGYISSQGTYNSATDIWNIETLASGASAILQLFVTPTSSVNGTNVTKNVTLINTNQTANVTVFVPAVIANLVLNITTSNPTPNVGEKFIYTIIVNNNGSDTATGVKVTDFIPAGLTFNGYTASQGNYNSTTGIWNVGTIANGTSATLLLYVTPKASVAGKNLINNATIPGQSVNVTIHVPKANVVLSKTTSNTAPRVGQQFRYIIIATNHGPDTATGVKVSDFIPAGLTFNGYTASQGNYNSATGIWNVGTIANDASATLLLYVTPKISLVGKTLTNEATIITQNEYNSEISNTTNVTVYIDSRINNITKNPVKTSANVQKVSMKSTGAPALPLILGLLVMIFGVAYKARKKLKKKK
ncbi:DUF11 domain-containing protein [Methanobrevibacter arboriphilus]|uniref:DUF11 domain-containing protein n=1 Tax=Methanobrevibacter arboriphilus TaxID=39441 RepID=UPI000A8DC355|nr:DUF11 domain-containing protein [Methanobrevibacter arboriphilus]